MSFVIASPQTMAAAAADLTGIRTALGDASAAALAPTTAIQAAAGDEVSAAIAALFGEYGQAYQVLSVRAAAFHDRFVQALTGAGFSYAATEAAAAPQLQTLQQDLLGAINAPTQTCMGRPLIGNGAGGTAANPNGGAGGLLYGNGYSEPAGSGLAGGAGGSGGAKAATAARAGRPRSAAVPAAMVHPAARVLRRPLGVGQASRAKAAAAAPTVGSAATACAVPDNQPPGRGGGQRRRSQRRRPQRHPHQRRRRRRRRGRHPHPGGPARQVRRPLAAGG